MITNIIRNQFIDAAAKCGADKTLILSMSHDLFSQDGEYKYCMFGSDDCTFTIYSNGEWFYDTPNKSLEGRMMRPHDRRWVRKLISMGIPKEYAVQEIVEWRGALGKRAFV